jgi:hypothetical protein
MSATAFLSILHAGKVIRTGERQLKKHHCAHLGQCFCPTQRSINMLLEGHGVFYFGSCDFTYDGKFGGPDPILSDKSKSKSTFFDILQREHDLAKALKNDSAEVPIHLWDNAGWVGAPAWLIDQKGGGAEPSEVFKQGISGLQQLGMRLYRRRLWKEIHAYLMKKFGQGWVDKGRRGGNRGASMEVKAVYEIL